jgi:hypothetical protein
MSIPEPILAARVSVPAILLAACSTTLDPTIEPQADGAPVTAADCVELENSGSRYWICLAPLVSFDAAERECRSRGAELASVESQAENDFLSASTQGLATHTNLWLGGSRDDDHVWSWPSGLVFWRGLSDGEAPPGSFANWKAGEPNDASTVSDQPERCAVLTLFDTQWNDRSCSLELSYYCESSP